MNSKLALTAIAMFVVIMGLGAISPAMAAPPDHANNDKSKAGKVSICHWQEVSDDPLTTYCDESEQSEWGVINVSKNAQKAHVGKHTDGTLFDAVIDDSEEPDPDPITTQACEDRNISEPEVPEVIPEV